MTSATFLSDLVPAELEPLLDPSSADLPHPAAIAATAMRVASAFSELPLMLLLPPGWIGSGWSFAVAADERDAVVEAVCPVAGVDDLDRLAVGAVGDAHDAHERAAGFDAQQLRFRLGGLHGLQVLVRFGDVDAGGVEQRIERGLLVGECLGIEPGPLADAAREDGGVHADRLAVDQAEPLDGDGVPPEPCCAAQSVVLALRGADGEQALRRRVSMTPNLLGERAQLRAALDEPRRLHERPAPLLTAHESLLLEVLERLDRGRAADVVPAHQLRLARDAVAGEQISGVDPVGDVLRELHVERTIAAR